MRTLLFLLSLSLAPQAVADESKKVSEETMAEAKRLRIQLEKHAERNAWAGVERTYLELEDLGVPMEKQDYLIGAQAARSIGEALQVRDRLIAAMNLNPDMNTVRWLTELQQEYGTVLLTSKKKGNKLEAKVPPFQPDRQQAITYAREQLEKKGRFEGLLPAGTYTFGPVEFQVGAGLDTAHIDLRKVK